MDVGVTQHNHVGFLQHQAWNYLSQRGCCAAGWAACQQLPNLFLRPTIRCKPSGPALQQRGFLCDFINATLLLIFCCWPLYLFLMLVVWTFLQIKLISSLGMWENAACQNISLPGNQDLLVHWSTLFLLGSQLSSSRSSQNKRNSLACSFRVPAALSRESPTVL